MRATWSVGAGKCCVTSLRGLRARSHVDRNLAVTRCRAGGDPRELVARYPGSTTPIAALPFKRCSLTPSMRGDPFASSEKRSAALARTSCCEWGAGSRQRSASLRGPRREGSRSAQHRSKRARARRLHAVRHRPRDPALGPVGPSGARVGSQRGSSARVASSSCESSLTGQRSTALRSSASISRRQRARTSSAPWPSSLRRSRSTRPSSTRATSISSPRVPSRLEALHPWADLHLASILPGPGGSSPPGSASRWHRTTTPASRSPSTRPTPARSSTASAQSPSAIAIAPAAPKRAAGQRSSTAASAMPGRRSAAQGRARRLSRPGLSVSGSTLCGELPRRRPPLARGHRRSAGRAVMSKVTPDAMVFFTLQPWTARKIAVRYFSGKSAGSVSSIRTPVRSWDSGSTS